MAVMLKSRQEIAQLREAGRIVAQTYGVLRPSVKPGISTAELDKIAEDFIRSKGATPIYKGYGARPARSGMPAIPAFPATICVAVNDVICHGIPSPKQILREGDIIGVDIGVIYKGWVGDACVTFPVGELDSESQRLMDVAQRCLELGIEQARADNRLGDIGAAIQSYAEGQGPCACPGRLLDSPGGQAQGPRTHSTPLLVPTIYLYRSNCSISLACAGVATGRSSSWAIRAMRATSSALLFASCPLR